MAVIIPKKITVGGLAGVGKTVLAKALSVRYSYIYMSAGGYVRSAAKRAGLDLNSFLALGLDIDKEVDARTREFGAKNECFVFEGRLAAFHIPDSFKIRVECEDTVRFARAAEGCADDVSLVEVVGRELISRDAIDKSRHEKIYPGLNLPDSIKYDLHIRSDLGSLEEEIEIIESHFAHYK